MGKHIQTAVLIAASAAALTGLTFWLGGSGGGLESRLRSFGLQTPLTGFKIIRESAQTVKDLPVSEIHARRDESEIKVTVIEKGAASLERYADQRIFDINSQFNRGISPYPGAVSTESRCPKEFLPVVENSAGTGWAGRKISVSANSRRQLGVCEEKERRFDVVVLILACEKTGNLFELSLYSSRDAERDPLTPALQAGQVVCL